MIKRPPTLSEKIKKSPTATKLVGILLPLGLGIILLVLWQTQLLHRMLGTDTFTLPLPGRIFSIMVENGAKIWLNAKATILVALVGLAAGSVIGYLLAILAAVFPVWGTGGLAIVGAFNAIPIVALAPVMTNWTKDFSKDANTRSMLAKILVVTIICIASMSVNAYRGLTELPPYSEDLMQSYAARKVVIFTKLRLPNSVPYIFTALKVSVPSSVISALVSEYFAEYIIGVGRQIRENILLAQYATAWAYITAACLIGIVMYIILLLVESVLLKRR